MKTRLTKKKLSYILELLNSGYSEKDIAKRTAYSRQMIGYIKAKYIIKRFELNEVGKQVQ